MADYLPKFKPGQAYTSQASAAITGGRLVAVSGSGTVATAGADSTAVVGVAAFDVAASGDKVTLYWGGVQRLVASGAITAGAGVVSDAAGKAKSATIATAAAAATLLGRALNTTTTDGDFVDVLIGG
jgi:hypothetical protein